MASTVTIDAAAASGHVALCDEIFNLLSMCPQPKYLQREIVPLLELHVEHQQPSLRTIRGVLQKAPVADGDIWNPLWFQPNIYFEGPRVRFGWKEPHTSQRFNSLQRFLKLR